MPNKKSISDLNCSNDVLKDIEIGDPVLLSQNGKDKYVILDIVEYQKNQTTIKLLSKLLEAEKAVITSDKRLPEDNILRDLGL